MKEIVPTRPNRQPFSRGKWGRRGTDYITKRLFTRTTGKQRGTRYGGLYFKSMGL